LETCKAELEEPERDDVSLAPWSVDAWLLDFRHLDSGCGELKIFDRRDRWINYAELESIATDIYLFDILFRWLAQPGRGCERRSTVERLCSLFAHTNLAIGLLVLKDPSLNYFD
jgi:hypothetical protein